MQKDFPFYQEVRDAHEKYLKSCHPRMSDEPDYGLVLEPEDDRYFREHAEMAGLDYDLMKSDFALAYQVIGPREHQESLELIEKNAVAINHLKDYFRGIVFGAIRYEQRKQHLKS